jgi:hypothetical protein
VEVLLEPHPDEMAVVQKIKAMYATGMSVFAVAVALTKEKVKGRHGRYYWHCSMVRRILQRHGVRSHKKKTRKERKAEMDKLKRKWDRERLAKLPPKAPALPKGPPVVFSK